MCFIQTRPCFLGWRGAAGAAKSMHMHSKPDTIQSSVEALRYPWENHPGEEQAVEVTPGVLWLRLKLPFRLNHGNIYLLADGDGWTAVDSGFGMDEGLTDKLLGRGQDYLKRVSVLPPSYRRISHGDEISIGTRRFKVITGGGHALDQVMLYCAADKLFLSADQVLSKISPNVSVWAVEPDQNSLGEYLASLASLTTTLPYDVMVLPGHGVPFYGLKTRIKQLADHHEDRCRLIAEACREIPQTSKELVPLVFHKHVLDAHQMGFAAGELIAHVNYMLVEGRLTSEVTDGVLRFSTT